MTLCRHLNIVLLPENDSRLQCEYCHLTIRADELIDGYCPECFEVHHKKHYDFKEIPAVNTENVKYRCEECGMIIESE